MIRKFNEWLLRLFPLVLLAFITLMSPQNVLATAGTHYEGTSGYDSITTTVAYEDYELVIYKVVFDMTADTTGTYYSNMCLISFIDRSTTAYMVGQTTNRAGTEDVNITLQYSMSGNPTVAASAAGIATETLDQLTASTMKSEDLTGLSKTSVYLSVKAVGQTSNSAHTCTVWVAVPKSEAAKKLYRKDMGKIVSITS